MIEKQIEVSRFKKSELLKTLERLFMGFYTSSMSEGMSASEREEVSLNYLAIKRTIMRSEAS